MKPEEPAEFLELIHFSLCPRVSLKNSVLLWSVVRSGHRHPNSGR